MTLFKKQPVKTVVGLSLEGSRLDAALLRRTNGSADVVKTHHAVLSLDMLQNEAVLVGREIRNQLDAGGIKERRCVVALPASWALTHLVELPADLAPEDEASFLDLEAESGFPCAVEDLQVATTRFECGGRRYAMQIGVRRPQIARLEDVLAAAQMKPVSFALGLATLPGAVPADGGAITAVVGERSVDVLLASGGIVSVRSLEGAFDAESGQTLLQADTVARELRITLWQLPDTVRAGIRSFNVAGNGPFAAELARELAPRAEAMGLAVRQVTAFAGPHYGMKLPAGALVSPALCVAAAFVGSGGVRLEFLPPKPTLLQQFMERYSTRRVGMIGAAGGTVAAVVIGLFAWQQVVLGGLRSEWETMRAKVTELEKIQTDIRAYRPWFDENVTTLSVLRKVSEAFPADPAVSAKTFEVQPVRKGTGITVAVSGVARDNQSLLRTMDMLRTNKEVSNIKVEQLRGKSPVQFTFNFNWSAAAAAGGAQ
jgi:hypothetical protein